MSPKSCNVTQGIVSEATQEMVSKVAQEWPARSQCRRSTYSNEGEDSSEEATKCLLQGPRPSKCLLQGQAWTNQTEIFLNYVKLGLRLIGNRSKHP